MQIRERSVILDLEPIFAADNTGATAVSSVLRTEVLAALIEAGIDKDTVYGIEATWQKKYFVVFEDKVHRNRNVGKLIRIRDIPISLRHPNPQYYQPRENKTRVRIFGYPLDAETEHLEKYLAIYGTFKSGSIIELTDRTCDLRTGARQVFMKIDKSIPSYIHVGPHVARVSYEGQPKTCRKCHQEGHEARSCTANVTCKACGSSDHTKILCPKVVCYYCGEQGHREQHCPKYFTEFPSMGLTNQDHPPPPMETSNNHQEDTTEPTENLTAESLIGQYMRDMIHIPSIDEWGATAWDSLPPTEIEIANTENTTDNQTPSETTQEDQTPTPPAKKQKTTDTQEEPSDTNNLPKENQLPQPTQDTIETSHAHDQQQPQIPIDSSIREEPENPNPRDPRDRSPLPRKTPSSPPKSPSKSTPKKSNIPIPKKPRPPARALWNSTRKPKPKKHQ